MKRGETSKYCPFHNLNISIMLEGGPKKIGYPPPPYRPPPHLILENASVQGNHTKSFFGEISVGSMGRGSIYAFFYIHNHIINPDPAEINLRERRDRTANSSIKLRSAHYQNVIFLHKNVKKMSLMTWERICMNVKGSCKKIFH